MPDTLQSLSGRMAAHTSWANTADRSQRTRPGREKFMRRFEDQVDPNRELPVEERAKRAESAKRAYFAALALKSAKARRRVALIAAITEAEDAESELAEFGGDAA